MSEKIVVPDFYRMRQGRRKIAMVTAYDYTFARLMDQANVDAVLVGDSLGTVVQGHDNTLPVTLDEVIYHAKMVMRGIERALVVVDMPFMSYQISAEEALFAAGRVVKETGAAAIKLEGGVRVAETIAKIVDADIPVMGHVGLTPQSVHKMGGYKVQGRQTRDARKLIDDAIAVEEAGAFALVLEGMPAELAREITETVDIPTIGIGAGKHCSGQVLVMHDLLGITPVDGEHVPKFVKRFAGLKDDIVAATEQYVGEVKNATFPGEEHSYEYSSKKVSGLRPVQK